MATFLSAMGAEPPLTSSLVPNYTGDSETAGVKNHDVQITSLMPWLFINNF